MPHAPRTRIGPAALVELSGPDARALAHAQFASDVRLLQPGHWQWSAWLDAQGRARFVFALGLAATDRLVAWLPLGDASAMATSLARFVFRSKVAVRAHTDGQMDLNLTSADAGVPAIDDGAWTIALPAPGGPSVVLSTDANAPGPVDAVALNRLHLAGIASRLPWLAEPLSGEFVGAALGLAALGATSLDKGCYPGQEIVARLHYRGGNKRHLAHVTFASPQLARPGEPIVSGTPDSPARCGTLLYAATGDDGMRHALAILDDARDPSAALRLGSGAALQRIDPAPFMAR